ncbi:MAG TPA: DUF3137 domain-containing protein [Bacteroidetes bacterium]|nr:DUF3137 domain-containing protein [Bacteroidota bacterium]
MQNPDNFRIFYNQTIHPELMRLDKERKRMLRRIFFSLVILFGVMALLWVLHIIEVGLVAIIPFGLYLYRQIRGIGRFRKDFKPRVVRLILDFIDDDPLFGDLSYEAERKIAPTKFYKSNIFGINPPVYEGEDFIEGRIGDVEFEMCELRVEDYSKVRKRLNLVFRGIFVAAKFFHPLKGALLVLPRSELPKRTEALKAFIRHKGQPMDPFVKHPAFTKIYTVYGSKNIKLHEVLTPELMDFILEARQRTGEIQMSIFEQHCYVAISNSKDILEPKILRSNVSFQLVREFYEDIHAALFIVRALDVAH